MLEIKGKSAIFTDIHIGRKQFDQNKAQQTLSYMEKEITQQIESGNISNVIILGDFYDHRRIIDWRIFNMVNSFFTKLDKICDNIVIVVGNHDCYYKNRIDENSLSYLGQMFDSVHIVEETQFIKHNEKNLLYVPWVVSGEDSNNPSKAKIKKADMILGHFEFVGFELLPGVMANHGQDSDMYKGKKVLSGHYHSSSEKNSVMYLGVCEQMTWSDHNSKKGYYILNEELELEFIENNSTERFVKIYFNSEADKKVTVMGIRETKQQFKSAVELLKQEDLTKHIIKVYVTDKSEIVEFNNFIVSLDMQHIKYILIDITPEMNDMIHLHHDSSNEVENVNDMLLGLIGEEDKKFFNEIYSEALQLNDG